jgi:hypothetical protein
MNLRRAFDFSLQDENWTSKLPLTLVIGLIPIADIAVIGWAMDLVRNMLDGQEHPMPDWNDLSEQFVRRWICGVKIAIVGFIYYLPMLAIEIVVNGISGGAAAATNSLGVVAATAFAVSCIMSVVSAVYWAVAWLPISIGILRFARSRNLNDMMGITTNWRIARENLPTMITLAVIVMVARLGLAIIFLIPCIGWILSLFSLTIAAVVLSHLLGQAGLLISGLDGLTQE